MLRCSLGGSGPVEVQCKPLSYLTVKVLLMTGRDRFEQGDCQESRGDPKGRWIPFDSDERAMSN